MNKVATKMTREQIEAQLHQFYGTQEYLRWSPLFRNFVLTDGARFIAESCEAFWLMDAIASYHAKLKNEEFQVWTLKVNQKPESKPAPMTIGAVLAHKDRPTPKAVLTCDDGNGNVIAKQEIEYTDFPLDEIKLYCQLGSVDGVNPMWVILLMSEY